MEEFEVAFDELLVIGTVFLPQQLQEIRWDRRGLSLWQPQGGRARTHDVLPRARFPLRFVIPFVERAHRIEHAGQDPVLAAQRLRGELPALELFDHFAHLLGNAAQITQEAFAAERALLMGKLLQGTLHLPLLRCQACQLCLLLWCEPPLEELLQRGGDSLLLESQLLQSFQESGGAGSLSHTGVRAGTGTCCLEGGERILQQEGCAVECLHSLLLCLRCRDGLSLRELFPSLLHGAQSNAEFPRHLRGNDEGLLGNGHDALCQGCHCAPQLLLLSGNVGEALQPRQSVPGCVPELLLLLGELQCVEHCLLQLALDLTGEIPLELFPELLEGTGSGAHLRGCLSLELLRLMEAPLLEVLPGLPEGFPRSWIVHLLRSSLECLLRSFRHDLAQETFQLLPFPLQALPLLLELPLALRQLFVLLRCLRPLGLPVERFLLFCHALQLPTESIELLLRLEAFQQTEGALQSCPKLLLVEAEVLQRLA